MQVKMNNKTTITIAILILLVLVLGGYLAFDKSSEYYKEKITLYYNTGYNNGASWWNDKVIDTAKNEGSLLYVNNQTEFKLPFEQMCEDEN